MRVMDERTDGRTDRHGIIVPLRLDGGQQFKCSWKIKKILDRSCRNNTYLRGHIPKAHVNKL